MGSVYAAWDPKLHREVALKVVNLRGSTESKARERFQREARAIAAARHPNIVEIYDYSGTDSQHLYLVIEKLDGEDLYATLYRRGIMPESVAAAIGHELCLALQVAHEAGIIHRDLKPENVFLNNTGRVVLTDFGIVKAVRENGAVDGYRENTDVIGTPGFMAPELMSGRSLGPTIDIYALGVLLYNITTKRLPFEGATPLDIFRAAAAGRYIDPRKHNPLLSEEFCNIIADCLQPNPKKRPRSAEMVRQSLKTVLEDNDMGDVRDDLHDYMANSEAYAQMSQSRAVGRLLDQIKVAIKDHNPQDVERYRQRLMVLDPYNDEVGEVSGVMQPLINRARRAGWRRLTAAMTSKVHALVNSGVFSLEHVRARLPRWTLPAAAGALLLLFGGTLYGVTHSHPSAPPALAAASAPPVIVPPPPTPQAPSSSLASTASPPTQPISPIAETPRHNAQVEVRVAGGSASLMVDGKDLGRVVRKVLQLTPGHHIFEVVKRGRGCKRIITLAGGDHLTIRADPRRKQINVQ